MIMKLLKEKIINENYLHHGDMIAIPFFLLAFIYFYRIKNKKIIEIVLMYFNFFAFIIDIIFTIVYF